MGSEEPPNQGQTCRWMGAMRVQLHKAVFVACLVGVCAAYAELRNGKDELSRIDQLVALVNSTDLNKQREAIQALSKYGVRARVASPALIRVFGSSDQKTCELAQATLASMGSAILS